MDRGLGMGRQGNRTVLYCTGYRDRHNNHRREIREASTPLSKHFQGCGYEHFSLQIIAGVREGGRRN